MQFGVFDHLDRGAGTLTQQYEDRLKLIEAYDAAGFRTYHLAEHHATTLGMAPSPSLFLAAVAQRSRTLRFGPMVYCLPFYHPVRLMEEICMLDQMSGGRLELGVGRGISPHEAAYFGIDADIAPAQYQEALELILTGLAGDELSYAGAYYNVDAMPVVMAPVQRPHPPLWYGVARPDSTVWTAQHSVNVITNRNAAITREITDRYRAEWQGLGRPADELPLIGMTRHVVVAEDAAQALACGRRAYLPWRHSFYVLWDRHGTKPIGVNLPETFDELIEQGLAIVGTPAAVRDEIARQVEVAGVNYMVCRFAFGDLTYAETRRSVDLFAAHVLHADF